MLVTGSSACSGFEEKSSFSAGLELGGPEHLAIE